MKVNFQLEQEVSSKLSPKISFIDHFQIFNLINLLYYSIHKYQIKIY